MSVSDLLLEIGCEELPTDYQQNLANALAANLEEQLQKYGIEYGNNQTFATPRRIAVIIQSVAISQPHQKTERLGPSIEHAYDSQGSPTMACLGFAKSLDIQVDDLVRKKTVKGERVAVIIEQAGQSTSALLPDIVNEAIKKLPIRKPMRWSNQPTQFIRPVHWVVLLFGREIIDSSVLGQTTDRATRGHRFHHPRSLIIHEPRDYMALLYSQGYVMAAFEKRKQFIIKQVNTRCDDQDTPIMPSALLNEVTCLVEWPVALRGKFSPEFLSIPQEILITSMQIHQKVFAVENAAGKLQPYFILISNIESRDPQSVIAGNQRVITARLSDAQFFYQNDMQRTLTSYLTPLKKVIFQKELGSLEDKCKRISKLAGHIAKKCDIDPAIAKQAGLLAKCDLLSEVVREFPSMQGTMGYYYALNDNQDPACANAIKEHYQPRFSGDNVPSTLFGAAVAIADKLDTVVGIIGINQTPSGDKDPFGLRRAAVGVLRILIEKQLPLDLMDLLKKATQHYSLTLPNQNTIADSFTFIQQRLKAYYQDQAIPTNVILAVEAQQITEPYDFDRRIKAVEHFRTLPQAIALASANKRVTNILKKQNLGKRAATINRSLFESEIETILVDALSQKDITTKELYQNADYAQSLSELSSLKEPIDLFFDQVMILSENNAVRENRLAILQSIQTLFGRVADISLLQ